jgi:hypothetical protein
MPPTWKHLPSNEPLRFIDSVLNGSARFDVQPLDQVSQVRMLNDGRSSAIVENHFGGAVIFDSHTFRQPATAGVRA